MILKKIPIATNNPAKVKLACTAKIQATVPQKRLPSVNKFGMCFFSIIFI